MHLLNGNPSLSFLCGAETNSWAKKKCHKELEVPTTVRPFQLGQRLAWWPAESMGTHSQCLRSTAELVVLIPCGVSGSGTKQWAAKILQGVSEPDFHRALEHWCSGRHRMDSCLQGQSGAFLPSRKPLRWIRVVGWKGSGSGGIHGRCDHPTGPGCRSRSHAQGTADRQLWGQERIFPPGQIGTGLQGFFPSLAELSRAPCQGSSGPFWIGSCLLLL